MTMKNDEIILRKAVWEDAEFLYCLRSDNEVRANSFSEGEITFDKHINWYKRKLITDSCKMYILECNKVKIGQIRIDEIMEHEWDISYSVEAKNRGRGYAKKMLNLLENELQKGTVLVGKVKSNNESSQAVFLHLNYKEYRTDYGYIYKKVLQ